MKSYVLGPGMPSESALRSSPPKLWTPPLDAAKAAPTEARVSAHQAATLGSKGSAVDRSPTPDTWRGTRVEWGRRNPKKTGSKNRFQAGNDWVNAGN